MADNILLVTYSGRTVTPQDDALVYEAAVSQSGIIYGGEVTFKNSNTLHIGAGHGIICGRKFTIIESDISIQLTAGAVNTGRLYVHLDLSNTTAPIQILTEIGTTLTAPIQQEDVNIINGVYEFNLATFTVDAQTVSSVLSVAPAIKSYPVLTAEEFESGSSDRGYLADASDVLAKFAAHKRAFDRSLSGLTFGKDEEGNWGYIPSGADAVIPFKKGGGYELAMQYVEGGYSTHSSSSEVYTVTKDCDAQLNLFGCISPSTSAGGSYELMYSLNGGSAVTLLNKSTNSGVGNKAISSQTLSLKAGDTIKFSANVERGGVGVAMYTMDALQDVATPSGMALVTTVTSEAWGANTDDIVETLELAAGKYMIFAVRTNGSGNTRGTVSPGKMTVTGADSVIELGGNCAFYVTVSEAKTITITATGSGSNKDASGKMYVYVFQ